MSEPAIAVRSLSKAYRLGVIGRRTLEDEVRYWWCKVRGRDPAQHMGRVGGHGRGPAPERPVASGAAENLFWALRDVSFEIQPGEVVGIIGRNGAGKSTLLKILSRITEPTEGEAVINGRVGSLLEVGTGFHPELTGRENIYMNGTILGMRKAEIDRKFDEIVAFSEIERFLDTPVKRYSSGMYVRLAFAVAAHLDPEILLVDEVLAVGDAAFQRKCLGKMGEVAHQGRTVLFVSHNMGAVQTLCEKGLMLGAGRVVAYGDTDTVIGAYLSEVESKAGIVRLEPTAAEACFTEVALRAPDGRPAVLFDVNQAVTIQTAYTLRHDIQGLEVYVRLHDRNGALVFHASQRSAADDRSGTYRGGHYRAEVSIPPGFLAPGRFFLTAGMQRQNLQRIEYRDNVASFQITTVGLPGHLMPHAAGLGAVLVAFPWRVERQARETAPAGRAVPAHAE